MKKHLYLNARFFLGLLRVPLILSVFSFPALVPGQTRPPVRTGAITGRVLGEDGSTVDGAIVFCTPFGSDSQSKTTTADEEGQFSFAELTPAAYRISARSPGYVLATTVGVDGQIARIGDSLSLSLVKGGVITGRVTNASGAPVIAVQVMAQRVRDAEGRLLRTDPFSRPRLTDDRGIYRLFGLTAGAYHVVANPMSGPGFASLYSLETSTYFPASNRDGATEVRVQAGEEVSGIDIAYGGGRGHTISGTVEGASSGLIDYGMAIDLQPAGGGRSVGSSYAQSRAGVMTFVVHGVADGDYMLLGTRYSNPQDEGLTTAPRRVVVRGSDVSGIKLIAVPLASIAGKVTIEAAREQPGKCSKTRESGLVESVIRVQRDEKDIDWYDLSQFLSMRSGWVSEKGDFLLRYIKAGQYRLLPDLPDDDWYIKEMSVPGAPAPKKINLGSSPLVLKAGDKISGATVTIAEGAAAIVGKLAGEKTRRGRWRVHLIPVEAARAGNTLFWYEVIAGTSGAFSISHVAPGKYWMISKLLVEDQPVDVPVRPVAWDSEAERTKLLREAEAGKIEVDLKSCARVKDYVLPVQ